MFRPLIPPLCELVRSVRKAFRPGRRRAQFAASRREVRHWRFMTQWKPGARTAVMALVLSATAVVFPRLSRTQPVPPPERTEPAGPVKETLHYTVEWRLVTAGKARLSLTPHPEPPSGSEPEAESEVKWRAGLHLESVGLVSKLFKVNNDYYALLNRELCALNSHLMTNEGSKKRETTVDFRREDHKAFYLERDLVKNVEASTHEIDVPDCVHEVVGGLYLLRNMDLEPGQSVEIPVSDGKKSVSAKVEVERREKVKTPSGVYDTTRYEIFLFNNVLYRRSGRLFVWLSNDPSRLPVQIRVRLQFHIGTITLQLEKIERT
ncbi:MAG: DUF3108 domain-containing protein [Bryobacteraceae bacterium]